MAHADDLKAIIELTVPQRPSPCASHGGSPVPECPWCLAYLDDMEVRGAMIESVIEAVMSQPPPCDAHSKVPMPECRQCCDRSNAIEVRKAIIKSLGSPHPAPPAHAEERAAHAEDRANDAEGGGVASRLDCLCCGEMVPAAAPPSHAEVSANEAEADLRGDQLQDVGFEQEADVAIQATGNDLNVASSCLCGGVSAAAAPSPAAVLRETSCINLFPALLNKAGSALRAVPRAVAAVASKKSVHAPTAGIASSPEAGSTSIAGASATAAADGISIGPAPVSAAHTEEIHNKAEADVASSAGAAVAVATLGISLGFASALAASSAEPPINAVLIKSQICAKTLFAYVEKTGFLELALTRRSLRSELKNFLEKKGLRFNLEALHINRLKSLDNHSRAKALKKLTGDAATAKMVLIHFSKDACEFVRVSVLESMVSLVERGIVERGDRVAIACVVKLLINDAVPTVRQTAKLKLLSLGTSGNTQAVVELLAKLVNPDIRERRRVMDDHLAKEASQGDPIALEGLSLCADSESAIIRAAAIRTMGIVTERQDSKTTSCIIRGFTDRDELVKLAALQAIAPLTPFAFGTVNGLRRCVGDTTSRSVRVHAISALAQEVLDAETTGCIAARLEDRTEDSRVKTAALRALTAFPKAVDATVSALIFACLNDHSEVVRQASIEALVNISKKGDPHPVQQVICLLNDQHAEVKVAAVRALAELSTEKSVGTVASISPLLTSPVEHVCVAAAEALARVAEPGSSAAVTCLVGAVRCEQNSRGATIAAALALSKVAAKGHADAVNALCGLLRFPPANFHGERCEKKPVDVREAALKALAVLAEPGCPDVEACIMAQREGGNPRKVRLAAEDAIAALQLSAAGT